MRCGMFATLVMAGVASAETMNYIWSQEKVLANGHKLEDVSSPLPHTYVADSDLPESFTWGDVNGTSFLTKSLNQHIPQYCGSCWAHGALSALGDRIKIARKAKGVDVNLAVQHVLNCGNAGSCHGGSPGAVYSWIKNNQDGVVFDTCNNYLACSSESSEGFCGHVDTTCKKENVCRTCSTFSSSGGFCSEINQFPNATVAEFGFVSGEAAMMKEIYARGPIAGYVDATPIHQYKGGIASGKCEGANHIISIVGWGVENGEKYWVVRNSWGEYWGEMGYFRASRGAGKSLCLETQANWATPAAWTENNFPCGEDGTGCNGKYVDPSQHGKAYGHILGQL
eukprot:TRINITY_DN227_c0_g3_i3.p1 TRINITY_DN227_c0_g3~~TRINITY_DN227_c0_g3_i3.p1  ORF type:complete len:339 (+),score=149.91 TRINITY_DN227_c0_g3_i3:69-1085(+)